MKNIKRYLQQKNIRISGIVFILAILFVLFLSYKTDIVYELEKPYSCTLMQRHKVNDRLYLNAENPTYEQVMKIEVPNIKRMTISCKGLVRNKETEIVFLIRDPETGKELYRLDGTVPELVAVNRKTVKLDCKVLKNYKGKKVSISVTLNNPLDTQIEILADSKPGLVESVNGDPNNHLNIVYKIKYGTARGLQKLYILFCLGTVIFMSVLYYCFICKKKTIIQMYIPVLLVFGCLSNFFIIPHGIPDEPYHIDTAYKYSNEILRVADTGQPGVIYKRVGDIVSADQLVNGVEKHSLWQMKTELFTIMNKEQSKLVAVPAMDTAHAVPTVVYAPSAFGISLGRLLHLSYMMTVMLGRLFNFLVYALLTFFALRFMPSGKNALAMVMLLPISVQQAMSLSYDCIVNGLLFLFIALVFYIENEKHVKRKYWILLGGVSVIMALVKGGVYIPLLLLFALLIRRYHLKRLTPKQWGVVGALVVGGVGLFVIKYVPVFKEILAAPLLAGDGRYTVGYVLRYPHRIVYMIYKAIIKVGDNNIAGMLGGRLSWLDIKINWYVLFIILAGLILLVHAEQDRVYASTKEKILYSIVVVWVTGMIMLSMLVSFTKPGAKYVQGLQGRYFLCLYPLLLMLSTTPMINVKKDQVPKIEMVMMTAFMFIYLCVVVHAI